MCSFSGKLPDHSILMCQLKDIILCFTCLDPQTTIVSERIQSKRQFKLDKMQTHFMVSQSSKSLQLINEILSAPTNNISSNDLYSKLVKFYVNELIKNVGYTGKGKSKMWAILVKETGTNPLEYTG